MPEGLGEAEGEEKGHPVEIDEDPEKGQMSEQSQPTLTSFSFFCFIFFLSLFLLFLSLLFSSSPRHPAPYIPSSLALLNLLHYPLSSHNQSAEQHVFRELGRDWTKGVKGCQFLVAAVTNYHQFGGLKQHRLHLEAESLKSRRWQGFNPLRAVGQGNYIQ